MESDPDFLGPAALAKGFRFVGDARDGATIERLERYSEEHGSGTAPAATSATSAARRSRSARRDRKARRGGHEGRDRPGHGRETREVVRHPAKTTGWLRETELRPEDAGRREGDQGDQVRDVASPEGQGAAAVPAACGRWTSRSRARSTTSLRNRDATGAAGIVQGEKALQHLAHAGEMIEGGPTHPYDDPRSFAKPYLPEEEPVA